MLEPLTSASPAAPLAVLGELLAALPSPAALWHRGTYVAAARPGGSVDPTAWPASLGEEVRAAAKAFMKQPQAADLIVGGGARPLIALAWRPLGDGWWLLTAGVANAPDPDSERRRGLLAVLSHEAKTPLITMRGYLELLRTRTELDERQRTYVVRALDEVDRQEAILDAWLHAACSVAGRLELTYAPVDLAEVLADAASAFGARHPARPLTTDVPRGLIAWADADRLAEVVANLLDNAERYGDASSPIQLIARADASEVVVGVIDRGPGIEPAELARLFEPFYRGRAADGTGTGLGLAVAEAIVRAHGGRIWAESEPGRGSTFSFAVPREKRAP